MSSETKQRGHYTFSTLIAIEADSEDEARRVLGRRLSRLTEAEYITGAGVMRLDKGATYDLAGELRSPS